MTCRGTLRLVVVLAAAGAACGNSKSAAPADPTPDVVRQYAVDLVASYEDALTEIDVLKSAVDAFVAAPSADGLVACQKAWLDAHHWYAESEISRFYAGPIDAAQGAMNEWPVDESFIDYTPKTPNGGIVNDPATYPQLTAQILATTDEKGGTENLSTGFHALEFLLWGERADQSQGPGTRPFTDYVDGGTAANAARRRAYLQIATQILRDDMRGLIDQWDLSDPQSYGAKLVAGPGKDGLTKIFRGFSQLAISELYYERLSDPVTSQNRKDEASCFSEDTLNDLIRNAMGVEDVYLGRYKTLAGGTMQGPSISALVRAKDPALDDEATKEIAAARAALEAIPPPFDHAVLAPPTAPEHVAVQKALDAFAPMQGTLDKIAKALGIVNNL
jgi:putative iron-regulated protein